MNRKTIEKAADNYAHEEWPSGLYECVSSDSFIADARYVLDHLCRLPWNEAIKELAEYAEEKKQDSRRTGCRGKNETENQTDTRK